jgi:hypothetical protein
MTVARSMQDSQCTILEWWNGNADLQATSRVRGFPMPDYEARLLKVH